MARRVEAVRAAAAELHETPLRAAVPTDLTMAERREVIATFSTLLESLYAHLPQKRATYGTDPVQRLRALASRVESIDEDEFHRSMAGIITELRDGHTRYLGPRHGPAEVAVLPFIVERFNDVNGEHFIASKVFAPDVGRRRMFRDAGLEDGVEITHWNGVAIARAIELYSDLETAGRVDARRARALQTLTIRPLRYALPPEEDWVHISFKRLDGGVGSIRLEWRFVPVADLPRASGTMGVAELAHAADPAAETARRVKKMLFAPSAWYASQRDQDATSAAGLSGEGGLVRPDDFADNVHADVWNSEVSPACGYLRLWSFDLVDDEAFVAHVIELLEPLPRTGLIIDLRGNPGGLIWAAERLLQLFTPHLVEPTRFSMLASDVSRTMAAAPHNRLSLAPWRDSLESAVISGELYSREVSLTAYDRCNDVGQQYPGPVVAVVDANTYSAGDLFAAGFVDNEVGSLVSVDEATGAGGANVWRAEHLARALLGTDAARPPLPHSIDFTLSFRRATRVRERSGTSIEDQGVRGHIRRPLTRTDLHHRNKDLKDFCASLLASERVTDMQFRLDANVLSIRTKGLDRVELRVDDRAFGAPAAVTVEDRGPLVFDVGSDWSEMALYGYSGAVLRQRRLLRPS